MTKFILLAVLLTQSVFCQSQTPSRIVIDSVYSSALNEMRTYCVYLPENFEPLKSDYTVITATDGQSIVKLDYKRNIDSLIANKIIPPVILIGVYSNETEISKGTSMRQYEYVYNFDAENEELKLRFEKHLAFFTEEVGNNVLAKWGINQFSDKSVFYGCSNGAGYGLYLYFTGKIKFGSYVCYSPLGYNVEIKRQKNRSEKLYISYGGEELFLLVDEYENLIKQLKDNGYKFNLTKFKGGHSELLWKEVFTKWLAASAKAL